MNRQIYLFLIVLLLSRTTGIAQDQVVTKGSRYIYLGYNFFTALKPSRPGSYFGPISAGYQRAFGNRITMGAELGYYSGKSDTYTDSIGYYSTINSYDIVRHLSVYALTIRADYHYLKNKKLDLYSGLSLGFAWTQVSLSITPKYPDENYSKYGILDLSPGIQVLGCRYMVTPRLGFYGEFNLRQMGYAVFGVSARLGTTRYK